MCDGCSRFFRDPVFEFCGDDAARWRGLHGRDLEGGMKSRLSSTIWALVLANGLAMLFVLWLAFSGGKKAGDASMFDFGSAGGGSVLFAIVVAIGMAVILAWRFGALLGPVQALAEFSERIAAGDPR